MPPRLIPAATAAADLPEEGALLTVPPRPACGDDKNNGGGWMSDATWALLPLRPESMKWVSPTNKQVTSAQPAWDC